MKPILSAINWHEVAAIVGHGLVTLAFLTYTAGLLAGRALHALNDRLATLWRVACCGPERAQTSEPEQSQPAPIPCRPLSAYRVSELRRLARVAGLPRCLSHSGRKADLIAALAY